MYVCICKAVTDKEIRRARAAGVDTLDDLQETLGVASCCGSCADTAQSILNESRGGTSAPRPGRYIPSAA
jgi:bacterioferritin-associated ferredoxin